MKALPVGYIGHVDSVGLKRSIIAFMRRLDTIQAFLWEFDVNRDEQIQQVNIELEKLLDGIKYVEEVCHG